jgi:exosortase/archaeosortase family protein
MAEACSGLRQLTAFLALAVAVGHLSGRTLWFKFALAALSGFVALAANCLRVVLTVAVLLWAGPRWAEGAFHTVEGLVVVGLGLLMLVAAAWGLRFLEDRLGRGRPAGWSPGRAPCTHGRRNSREIPAKAGTPTGLRVAVVAGTVGIALAAKTALFQHLQAAGPLPSVHLTSPLQAFPFGLERWTGQEAVTDPRFVYGDDHLSRVYQPGDHSQAFYLWMVYSATGEDRGHHPEVCMRAAGMPEDPRGRKSLPAPGHSQPIQEYRFGRAGEGEGLVGFYWYYTLEPPAAESASALQRAYQRCQRRPASLTIEVFTRVVAEQDVRVARDFVLAVDRAAQAFLPAGAVRGSRRLPVFLVNEGSVRAQ